MQTQLLIAGRLIAGEGDAEAVPGGRALLRRTGPCY